MSVVVVGVEHHRTPLHVLEKVTIGDQDLPKVLGSLRDAVNLQESVVVSTCLRTELYAVVDRFHEAVSEVQELLAGRAGCEPEALESFLDVRFDDDVTSHLFAVAAGLESAIPGETEVLGQVRRAWERARQEKVSGPVLDGLFRHAVSTGRRARAETGIARGTTSFSHAAVELARSQMAGGLAGRRVLVVGAGEMGEGLLGALTSRPAGQGPAGVVVANRTVARAERLVEALGATGGDLHLEAVGLEELAGLAPGVSLVLASADVEGRGPLLDQAALVPDGQREREPLLVVDLGVPRNVAPEVGALPGVTVLSLEDVSRSVSGAIEERRREVEAARLIVAEEVHRYRAASRARGAAPVVAALRARLEEQRQVELARRRSQFGALTPESWEQVDAVTRAVLAKLVHEPTMVLKETAGSSRGERLVEALRTLFGL